MEGHHAKRPCRSLLPAHVTCKWKHLLYCIEFLQAAARGGDWLEGGIYGVHLYKGLAMSMSCSTSHYSAGQNRYDKCKVSTGVAYVRGFAGHMGFLSV